jgi:putative ABC transport system permease protein
VNVQFKLAWRYLRGRGARTLLTTLAVVFGVMLIFGLNGIMPPLMNAFTRNLLSTAGKIDASITSTFGDPFPSSVLDKVANVPGVAAATPEIQRPVPLAPRAGVATADQVAQVNVIGVDPATVSRVRDFPVTSGRALQVGDGNVVVLASDLATKLGLSVGGSIDLPSSVGTTRYTVIGLLSTATLPGQEQVFVPLSSAQALFAFGQRINAIEASFIASADRTTVETAIRKSVGSDFQIGGLSTNSSLLASLQVSTIMFNMFGIFALATGGFIILNSFRTVVAERRRDVGMLRAIGATRRTIVGMFLIESVFQGILGTAIGIAAGWSMAAGLLALLGPLFESIVHVAIGGPEFAAGTWVMAALLGVGVTVLAAIIPALAAGRVTPMEAMRPQLGEVYERRVGKRAWIGLGLMVVSAFCIATRQPGLVGLGSIVFLIAIALVTPAIVNPLANAFGEAIELIFAEEGGIARSNLERNPGRSAITVTAIMLGLASIVAMLGVVASIFAGFTGYIDKSLSADYMFIPQSIILGQGNVGAGPRLAEEVRHAPGIGAVSTLRLATAKVAGVAVQVIGIDPKTYPQVAAFEWNTPSTQAALGQLSQGRWIIANGIYAAQHQLVIGQAIALETPNGTRTYHLAGIGNDYLNAKLSTIYVSQDNLARDFNSTSDLLIMANRQSGADPKLLLKKLDAIAANYPAFKLYQSAEWRTAQLTIFNETYVIFYGLIAALALPSLLALLNTLAISVLARTREIGMLRAVGSTRRQVRRMVMAESLLLSIIGTAFGVIAGVVLGYALVLSMSTIGWPMPYFFPWDGVIATIVVGITFGVLAAIVPARSASRLNVVDALHFE